MPIIDFLGKENEPDRLVLAILLICIIMSIQLLRGEWSFLIAGYNTASKEEKEQYDEKKLCRVIGCCMLIISVLIFIMWITDGAIPASIAITIIMLDILVTLIYANTKCKKK